MSIKVLMPALSPTMTEGKLAKWNVSVGDTVSSGDVIAEIETDKATMEVETIDDGVVAKIYVQEGTENVPVNNLIALLAEEGEDVDTVILEYENLLSFDFSAVSKGENYSNNDNTNNDVSNNNVSNNDNISVAKFDVEENVQKNNDTLNNNGHSKSDRIFASPLARRIAEQKNIDLKNLSGTGPKGRIIKVDVESYADNSSASQSFAKNYPVLNRQIETEPQYEEVPVSGMRKVIASRLTESKSNVPHFYVSMDVEIDRLLEARKYINQFGDGEYKVSVNDMVIKAVATGLAKVPDANVSWAGDFIKMYKSVDVSVAVSIEGGLITPIVRDADRKDLISISKEVKELVKKAKSGSLAPSEYQGGSVSVSNLGMFGVDNFQAIVNPPQGLIIAVGAGREKAVSKNGKIVSANVMNITASADHRAIDGAVCAMVLGEIKKALEEPIALTL